MLDFLCPLIDPVTLNVLLSFAQFEREVSGERIRDKIAASKAKGMWQGGRAPLGFDIGDRRLVINENDAIIAKHIFELYLKIGCITKLATECRIQNIKSRKRISKRGLKYGGKYFSRGALHAMLTNPVYIGKISHKGTIHEGLHDAIIPQKLWDEVQDMLQGKAPLQRGEEKQKHKNLLTGLIYDEYENPYTPVFTKKKNGKHYRYYSNMKLAENKLHPDKTRSRLPSHEIESFIEKAVRDNITQLANTDEHIILNHILNHHETIPTYDLIRSCVRRVIIYFDHVVIKSDQTKFKKLVKEHLSVSVTGSNETFEITKPFQTSRGRDTSIIIQSEDKNIFDMSSEDTKRLVQGIVWREEHFNGTYISNIAKRENCSSRYVRNRIMGSFELLN